MLAIGSVAPDFVLNNQNGEPFQLSALRGRKNVLLFFIPAAFTPICTTEVPALAALAARFDAEADAAVVVVTPDNAPTNAAWLRHLGIDNLTVLSDWAPHGLVSRAYDAWLPADSICDRASVLVDKAGRIVFAQSAGKFGKRLVPGLLEIATRAAGGVPAPAGATALMPLDLPVLYVTKGCPFCKRVRAWVASQGLGDRVVVRELDGDMDAVRAMLAVAPDGGVPTLARNGKLVAQGDNLVIPALREMLQK